MAANQVLRFMRGNSVLEWPEAAPSPPASNEVRVRLEYFRPGSVRKIVLLDQPQLRYQHWDASLRKHVPCFDGRRTIPDATAASSCPKCLSRDYVGTRRREGYAPAMLLNVGLSCWEQVVAVFTAGGLAQIEDLIATPTDEGEPRQYRGLTLAVVKTQQGGATPMKIEERPRLKSDEMPGGLPPTFNVRPILFAKWFPDRECDEPVTLIAPIPLTKRRSRLDVAAELEAIELPTEVLIANLRETHARLVEFNMPQRAAQIAAQLAVLTQSHNQSHEANPPSAAGPAPVTPVQPPTAAPPAAPRPTPKVQPEPFSDPVAEAVDELQDLGVIPREAIDRTGTTICNETRDRLPDGHPAKGKGGPVPASEEVDRIIGGVKSRLRIAPSTNGHAPKGGAQ